MFAPVFAAENVCSHRKAALSVFYIIYKKNGNGSYYFFIYSIKNTCNSISIMVAYT